MSESLVLHQLLQIPAHQLVQQAYQLILNRSASLPEEAYHLARLYRGCSPKLFLLSILYSAEAQERYPHQYFVGGRALRLFHKVAKGRPKLAKLLIKLLYYSDVISGRARKFAYQFQAEYQLNIQQAWQQQLAQLRHEGHLLQQEAHMLQQDVQRRVDLFLLEAMQTMTSNTLTPDEKDAWRQRLEQAKGQL